MIFDSYFILLSESILEMNSESQSKRTSLVFQNLKELENRVVIKNIELENFKSYCGKHVIGPFHSNFSAVIGPNGSGKSNLLDALVFIFGKRASWMRLKALKELIHRGDCKCQKALVTVEFSEINNQGKEIGNFSVTRTITLNDEVGYKINGQKSTHDEVVRKLKIKGIDLVHNRFMILQGEVEQIALMKPKGSAETPGFLEYLEEIIGTDKYVDRIDELEKSYQQLKLTRMEQLEHYKIAEEEMRQFLKMRDIALDFLNSEEKCFQLSSFRIQVDIFGAQETLNALENEMETLKKGEEEMKNKLATMTDFYKPQIENYAKMKLFVDRISEALTKSDSAFKKLENEYNLEKEKLKDLGASLLNKDQEIEQIQKKINRLIEDQAQNEENLPDLKNKLSHEEQNFNRLRQEINESEKKLINRFKQLFEERGEAEEELRKISEKLGLVQRDFDLKNRALIKDTENSKLLQQKEIELKSKMLQTQSTLEDKIRGAKEMTIALEACSKTLKEDISFQEKYKKENFSLEIEFKKLQSSALAAKERLQQTSKNAVIYQRLHAASTVEKILTGIIGRVGDAVIADERLNYAVSCAGGGNWNKVLVKTAIEAVAAINYLRTNQIGSCAFLAIDKQDSLKKKMEEAFTPPKNSVRLFDLLLFKNSYAKLGAYFSLGDTLLVDNISIGREVAFSGSTRWRVVTLAGQIIERSGTMTGGGIPFKNLISLSSAKESVSNFTELTQLLLSKVEDLKTDYQYSQNETEGAEKLIVEFQNLRSKLNKIKEEIDKIEAKTDETKKDQITLVERLRKEKKQIEIEESLLSDLKKELESVQNKLSDQNEKKISEINSIQDEILQIQNKTEIYQEKLAIIQEKIAKKGGDELIKLHKQLKKIEILKTKLSEDVLEELGKKDNIKEVLNNLKKQYDKIVDEKQALENRKKIIDVEIMRLLGEAEEVMKENNTKTQELATKKEELSKTGRELEGFRKETEDIKKGIDDKNKEIFLIERRKLEAQSLIVRLTESLKKIFKEFKDTISTYDFYSDLEHIKNITCNFTDHISPSRASPEYNEENSFAKRSKKTLNWEEVWTVKVGERYSSAQLKQFWELTAEIDLKYGFEQKKKAKKSPNLDILNRIKNKYLAFKKKHDDFSMVKQNVERIKEDLDSIKEKRKHEFFEGFNVICARLKETYDALTDGGSAELELMDPGDPFSQGIHYSVRPPGKSWKQMLKLSGGEKTLSSLALVFALHYYKPNPVYFMDEIDAALDFKNVSIVAKFVKRKTQNAQFLVISLRNSMFEVAEQLFGVYKEAKTSRIVSLVPHIFTRKFLEIEPDE